MIETRIRYPNKYFEIGDIVVEAVISDRILEKEREKKKRKTAILLSLIVHLFVLNVIVFLPHKNYVGDDDFVKIDWMQEVPKERLRRMQVKPKVKPERVLKPDQLLARTAKLKKAETPKNKLTEVKKWEERLLLKNADQAMYYAKESGKNQYSFYKSIP